MIHFIRSILSMFINLEPVEYQTVMTPRGPERRAVRRINSKTVELV